MVPVGALAVRVKVWAVAVVNTSEPGVRLMPAVPVSAVETVRDPLGAADGVTVTVTV